MSEPKSGFRVRRVGFRHGSDAELAAMHLVETEIESERCPGSEPQPLASYMRFARNLPSLFDDHTWVADLGDGTPIGCGACWSNSAGDAGHMESYVYVRRPMRRRGVGSALAREVLRTAIEEGRSSISWSTYDTIPAGESFSKSLGGSVGRVSRNSELQVARLDLNQLDSWIASARLRAHGYRLQFWDGPYSNELLGAAANFHRLMNTQPRDAMATGDIRIDADHVAELDRALQEAGRDRWTVFVRNPSGNAIGGTEVVFEPWAPAVVQQMNTAIDPAHRGLGLAKWAKAEVLRRLHRERPAVAIVRTGNAFSNAAMLAINDALGFEIVEVRTEWRLMVNPGT